MWCIADLDEEYIEKMEDVLSIYEKPLDPTEPVVCIDEKPVTLHGELKPPIPAAPGKLAKRDNEYERCGTANVFCAVEPKAGKHFNVATPDRSGPEFVKAVDAIAQHYPAASTIHLVMDNLNIHHRKTFIDYFGPDRGAQMWDRLTVHYTPKHGSWLNQAEIEISLFARQCLGRRRIPDLDTLRRETHDWNKRLNRERIKINWQFTRKKARLKFHYKRNRSKRS